ncbi:MAG: NUDIX domain-containing protein [Janthinobacterium lividum]
MVTTAKVYLDGSDIKSNYPVLFGIKQGAVQNKLEIDKSLALHEVKSPDLLGLADSITHVEVPEARIEEIRALFEANNIAHIPVIAIEDCEVYLSNFNLKDVFDNDFRKPKSANLNYVRKNETKSARVYDIQGPGSIETALQNAQPITSAELMGDKFKWESGKRYASGLIPIRKNEQGELEVFMVRRSHLVLHGGNWATPAGGASARKDRNPLMAPIRESEEELGLTPEGKINVKPYVLSNAKSSRVFHGFLWDVNEANFTPKLNWENSGAKWVPLSDIEIGDPSVMEQCGAVLEHLKHATDA